MKKLYLIILFLGLVSCSETEPLPTYQPTAILLTPTVSPASLPATFTPKPLIRLTADPAVPADLITAVRTFSQQRPDQFTWVESGTADVALTVGQGMPLAQWVYVVAAPFATIIDDISGAELQTLWQAEQLADRSFIVMAESMPSLIPILGAPGTAVQTSPGSEVVARLWEQRPALTIMPFHRLTPDLKVLRLDGSSPLRHAFDVDTYPLAVSVGVSGLESAVHIFLAAWDGPTTNRDPARLTRLTMSGVTALTRATAYQMEVHSVTHPGTAVAPILQNADIAHVSNEVSFAPDCPYPNPVGGTTFCSRDSYFTLLEDLGIDVVELTGNHINDWGADSLLHSLDLYEAAGMVYFGGGRDAEDAGQPALFTHHGNQIAFVGCNWVGPGYAWATETRAGARACNEAFYTQIAQLHTEGYLVIATLQYHEFYHYAPTAQQQTDFQAVVAAGAAAVSGSQGHYAQGFDFHHGAFIHYGLGNLFFDQMDLLGTRQTFLDTYVIYAGRLISVELWTGLLENWCCPRLMTAAEREQVLTAVFQASGW